MNNDLSNDLENIRDNLIPPDKQKKPKTNPKDQDMAEDEKTNILIDEYISNLSPWILGLYNSLIFSILICLALKTFAYSMISWSGILFLICAFVSLTIVISIFAAIDISKKINKDKKNDIIV